jgi:fatty-acid desaturase
MEKLFYWLTFIFQGSSFLSPYAYGVMHRLHHAFADTEHDPHSPSFSKNLFDMMWKTKNYYQEIVHRVDTIESKFKTGDTREVENFAMKKIISGHSKELEYDKDKKSLRIKGYTETPYDKEIKSK